METETLSKLYLELANVVPPETLSAREISLKEQVKHLMQSLETIAEMASDMWAGRRSYNNVSHIARIAHEALEPPEQAGEEG